MKSAAHLKRVRQLPCGVCGAFPPSYAHHIRTGQGMAQKAPDYLAVPLCWECHEGKEGIHGNRWRWASRKLDELIVLADTIRRLCA